MTDLERKIAIEPLDADRVARLERDVMTAYRGMARVPRSSRRWLLQPLLVAGAVAAVFVGWLALRSRGDGGETAAVVVPAPSVQKVRTGAGPSVVDVGEAVITVDRDTEIEIRRDAGGIQVLLAHGAVNCEVAPRHGRPPFVVDAGEVDVTVVGTAFRVERDGEVRVTVTHGVVRVDAPSGTLAVAAGERWAGGEKVAMVEPPAKPDPRRPVVLPPVVARTDGPAAPRPVARPKKLPVRIEHPRPAEPAHRAPRTSLAPILAIDGVTDANDLVGRYMKMIADQNFGSARHALYSMAWVQLFKLRSPGDAIRSALWFERRFAGGDFAEDALIIRIIATCDRGASESCRAAAHTYVRRFSSGKYADDARAITEWDVTR